MKTLQQIIENSPESIDESQDKNDELVGKLSFVAEHTENLLYAAANGEFIEEEIVENLFNLTRKTLSECTHINFEDHVILEDDDPCWDDYEMVGQKEKNGKKVPNCVKK